MRRLLPALLAALLLPGGALSASQTAAPRASPLEPAASGGLEAVDRALAKLSIHARLLVIGAHPDDEDNALLAYVSRGLGAEAAYLSLSRGEGGQNLIGPELGEPLGLIRTGELMAARAIEGTRQYFARAYDFGYTRSLDETFERWPREVLLEDAIRAARRFKPQVVVAIFPADARAGHGQHQASAVIAGEVFERTGDPSLFSELGLPAWAPAAFYRRAWSREEATLAFSLGSLYPVDGRSIGQIAAASRSQHRSQDMGRTQPIGDFRGGLKWIAGGAGEAGDGPFAGIDTSLAALASTLPEGTPRSEIEIRLARVETLARRARASLAPVALERAVEPLASVLGELHAARQVLASAFGEPPSSTAAAAVGDLLDEKIAVAEAGLAAAAGVVVDAVADREAVPVGGSVAVSASYWATGSAPVDLVAITLESADGWAPKAAEPEEDEAARGLISRHFRVEVPIAAGASKPYFLERPRKGDLYDWADVPEWLRGVPMRPGLTARFELTIGGSPVTLEREVVHRYADQAIGEIRRPVRAVPAVEVTMEPKREFLRIGMDTAKPSFEISLSSNLDREVSGAFRTWLVDEPAPSEGKGMTLPAGGRLTLNYRLVPGDLERGAYDVAAEFATAEATYGSSVPVLEYPHTRPAPIEVPAVAEIRALAIELPEVERVGYIRGASDRIPEQLEKIGIPIEPLDLERSDRPPLAAYDVIVIGSRAYEVDPVLRARNDELLTWVERGGTLIVQYQQYQFVRGGFAPLPIEIGRPHGRITDESSPVEVLEPSHPVFNRPNRIEDADWEDWVQERGLYFAAEWDPAYTPLLALRDPGDQPEQRGSLLVAEVGDGIYVYTGLAFFRELPAGVPGAFRLFANLLALGER